MNNRTITVAAKLDEVRVRLAAIRLRNATGDLTPKRLHDELAGTIEEIDRLRRAAGRAA